MIIVHVVEPFAAGVAVFVKSLTETMGDELHIVIHGERKLVMSAKDVKKTFPKGNVRFIRWKSAQRNINPLKDFYAFSELYKILRRLKKKSLVDAVHLHSSKSGFLGRLACRMAGIHNVVYTPNGAPFLSGTGAVKRFIYKRIEKFGNRLGGRVVCCSSSELSEYTKLGIKAEYINNGIQVHNANSTPLKPAKSDKLIVITTGRIEEQKGPALFNEIASYFEDFDQIEFIWAGDGQSRDLLTASNITITGWLTSEEIISLVNQADVYLSTSLFEGLSFGVLEALALRKPVLLSNCVGNADVVKDGLNGDIYRNQTEAIAKILNYLFNRELIDVMGQYSQDICHAEFDMHQNFKGYKDYYGAQTLV
jgi:glycosyltransferase involved in cell wall biosynthesis